MQEIGDKTLFLQNILTVPMVSRQYIEYILDYARFMSKNVFEILRKLVKEVLLEMVPWNW